MESSILTTLVLPVILAIIMLGLGLSLVTDDFKRVLTMPRAVLVGLICQAVLLPAVCFAIAKASGLGPELAVGLMLLAASPGGATSNLYSHLAHGDVALNISLTAINSVLTVVTLPLIVNFSLEHFMGESRAIPLQFDKVAQICGLVLGPVAIGMGVRSKRPALADRLQRPMKLLSTLFLVGVIGATVYRHREVVGAYFQQVGAAALAFNVVSLAVGYCVPRLLRLNTKQAIAIGMEIGIHNGALAITIASSPLLLNNGTMAIPPAVYSLIMYFTAAVFAYLVTGSQRAPVASPSGVTPER